MPYEWKSAQLELNFLLCVTTQNKKYLAIILNNPTAIGSFTRYNNAGLVDIGNEGAFYPLPNYLATFIYFQNYNNDDTLEFLSQEDLRHTDTSANTNYRYLLYKIVAGLPYTELVKNAHGLPLGFDFIDSAGKYYISEVRK